MLKTLKQFLFRKQKSCDKSSEEIQSFTYYIPGPSRRSSKRSHGYREKQFDTIFTKFINSGHQIISYQTVPHNGAEQSGMWFICLLKVDKNSSTSKTFDEIEQELESEMKQINQNSDDMEIYPL